MADPNCQLLDSSASESREGKEMKNTSSMSKQHEINTRQNRMSKFSVDDLRQGFWAVRLQAYSYHHMLTGIMMVVIFQKDSLAPTRKSYVSKHFERLWWRRLDDDNSQEVPKSNEYASSNCPQVKLVPPTSAVKIQWTTKECNSPPILESLVENSEKLQQVFN